MSARRHNAPCAPHCAADEASGSAEPEGRSRSNDGYNLVLLAVVVTLLNIWIAASLPLYSLQYNRAKEEALIFRGLQIAEGIRVFLLRTGQYPTSLNQLLENEPRCIRQLWRNPMREDGRWGLIPVGTTGQNVGGGGGAGAGDGGTGTGNSGLPNPAGSDPNNPSGVILSADPDSDGFGQPANTVAIRGVFSPDGEDAIKNFLGKESITEWQFTVELVSALRQGTPDRPLANPRPFLIDQVGKPFPPGVVPPIAMPSPDAQQNQNPPPGPNEDPDRG